MSREMKGRKFPSENRNISAGSSRAVPDPAPPDPCIIYERWHILRLNICWFVTRSRPSPWHTSLADRKQRCAFNWWVPRLVTRSPGLPSLLSSAPTEDVQKEERKTNKWVGRPACIGQGHSFPSGEDSFLEVPPTPTTIPLHLFALTPLYVRFHLKAPTTYLEKTEMDREKQAGGGGVAPFVKTAAGR